MAGEMQVPRDIASPNEPFKATHFVALDGLRGVAALAVLFFHLPRGPLKALVPAGYLAVDFFFVLSGFVLAHAYLERLRNRMGPIEFMARRYIRLWPLYILGSLPGFALVLINSRPTGALAVSISLGLLFLPVVSSRYSADHSRLFPFNGPLWSVFCELLANLALALVAPRLGWRVLTAMLSFGAVGLVAVRLYYGDLDAGSRVDDFPAGIGRVWWSFFAGVLVHRVWKTRPAGRLPFWLVTALLIAAMTSVELELLWVLVGFPLLTYFAASAVPAGWVERICLHLGAASYGVYTIHKPIIELLRKTVDLSAPLTGLLFAASILAVALIITPLVDVPIRRMLGRVALSKVSGGQRKPVTPGMSAADHLSS